MKGIIRCGTWTGEYRAERQDHDEAPPLDEAPRQPELARMPLGYQVCLKVHARWWCQKEPARTQANRDSFVHCPSRGSHDANAQRSHRTRSSATTWLESPSGRQYQ